MKFNLERSSVTLKISIIKINDKNFYRISSFRWGPLLVPTNKLEIKIVPDALKSISYILVDVVDPNTSVNHPCKEAIIAGEKEEDLREYFRNSNVPFPEHKNSLTEMQNSLVCLAGREKLTQEQKESLIEEIQGLCNHKNTVFAFDGKEQIFTLCAFCGKEEKFLFTRSTIIKLKKMGFRTIDIKVLFSRKKRLFKKLGIE